MKYFFFVYLKDLLDYILNYIFSNNVGAYSLYQTNLTNLDVNLSYRVGAFTNKSQFNLLLESKTPLSSGSVFIPQEDFTIFLNKSSAVKKLVYSGVIVTKLSTGLVTLLESMLRIIISLSYKFNIFNF